jgi:hypothetical protein
MTNRSTRRRDRRALELGMQYLHEMRPKEVPHDEIARYLEPRPRKAHLADIYLQACQSAKNLQMTAPVLKAGIGRVENLHAVLCEFEPAAVVKRYDSGERLFEEIRESLRNGGIFADSRGRIRDDPRAIFPKFCRSCLSAATFFANFRTAEDFYAWAALFNVEDDDIRLALPKVLHRNIKGLGFALSCDFLKEIGFQHFGKPDTWIKSQFEDLGLSEKHSTDEQILLDLFRVARNAGVTAFVVDKVFWLIGSGRFGFHNAEAKGQSPKFIRFAKKRLKALD